MNLTKEQMVRIKITKDDFDSILKEREGSLSNEDKVNFKETIENIIFEFTKDLQWQIGDIKKYVNEEMKSYLHLL